MEPKRHKDNYNVLSEEDKKYLEEFSVYCDYVSTLDWWRE